MADSISTLALRVDSQTALAHLNEFGVAAANLGSKTDVLKAKLLQLNARFLGLNFAKALVNQAAEGQEATGKFDAVVGRFGERAKKVTQDLARDFNYSGAAAKRAVAGMVDIFTGAGLSIEDSLSMAETLNKRAADIEAFTNAIGGVEHVADQLTSATLGNNMAVRSLGIVLTEEAVQAQMAREKMEGLSFASDRAAKVHARVSVMLRQSASSHGQVARETDNYANRARYLRARLAELRSGLGEALLPTFTKFVSSTATLVENFNKLSPQTKSAVVGVGALTGALITFSPWIKTIGSGIAFFSGALGTLGTGIAKNTAAVAAETIAQQRQNTVQTQSTVASSATTAAKKAEAAARAKNAAAMGLENAANTKTATFGTLGNIARITPGGVAGTAASKMPFAGLTRFFTNIAKATPIINKLGAGFAGFVGVAGTAVTVVGAVIGSFELLKRAPQWLEMAFDKIPSIFSTIADKAISGIKAAGKGAAKYAKDLVVGGLVGAGQVTKRLLGYETAASREYALNKQIEANIKKREELQELERRRLAAEQTLIQTIEATSRMRFNAQLEFNASRDTDAFKLTREVSNRDSLNAQIIRGEQELWQSLKKIDSGKLTPDKLEKEEERAKELSTRLEELNKQWLESSLTVDKLTQQISETKKAFVKDGELIENTKEDSRKALTLAQTQNERERAATLRSRRDIMSAQLEEAKLKLKESEDAETKAGELHGKVGAMQDSLLSPRVAQALLNLENLAKSGDYRSDSARLEFASSVLTLEKEGGYKFSDAEQMFDKGGALRVLQLATAQRKSDQEELDEVIRERDKYQQIASERSSRYQDLMQIENEISEQEKQFSKLKLDEKRQREQELAQRQRDQLGFEQTLRDRYHSRQLSAIDEYYGDNTLGALQAKHAAISSKGSGEWNLSTATLQRQQQEIQKITSSLAELNIRFLEGTLSDDEAQEREYLQQLLRNLEGQFESDYREAVQRRIAVEDELLGLEKNARAEFATNLRNFVDFQGDTLKDRLNEQQELAKKRFEERTESLKEDRKPIESLGALSSGSSAAFEIASRIYQGGEDDKKPEKNIEKSTAQIETLIAAIKEQMQVYFQQQQNGFVLSMG